MAQVKEQYKNNDTKAIYEVYAITGEGKKATPGTEPIVWLKLVPTKGWVVGTLSLRNQQYISIPESALATEFFNVKPR
jgi:hypothetical protein